MKEMLSSKDRMLSPKKQGALLKQYREAKGLSQEALYDLIFPDDKRHSDYKRPYISTWETQRGIPKNYIDNVARALNIPRSYLLGSDIASSIKKIQNDTVEQIGIYINILRASKHRVEPMISSDKRLLDQMGDASSAFSGAIQHLYINTGDWNSFVYAVRIDDNVFDLASLEKMISAAMNTIDTIVDNMLLTASISTHSTGKI